MSEWKETAIGLIPIDWELKTVDEIKSPEKKSIISGPFGSNISAKFFVSKGIPVVRGNNLSLNLGIKFKDDGFVFITEEKANELGTWAIKDDIIFTAVGTIGQVGILTGTEKYEKYIISNKQLRIRIDKSLIEPLYAYYWFASPQMVETIEQRNTGSSVPLINLSVLKSLCIPLPTKGERLQIVEILSSLDDKIDLLKRQIKTLEQLAETLFRQWFVEEGDKQEEIILGDYVQRINGYSYNSSELKPSEVAMVTLKSFNRDGSFRMDGFKEFTGKINEHQIVKQGDLVVAHTDITQEADVIGNPVLVIEHPKYKTLVITMDCVKVVPKDERLSIPFLYFLMKTREFKFHCLGCANGTTVLHLSKEAIPSFSFPKPDFEKVKLFTEQAKNIIQKIFNNHSQIQTITKLRDTLLPKLMSGELRVGN